jgi:hypothetical protein
LLPFATSSAKRSSLVLPGVVPVGRKVVAPPSVVAPSTSRVVRARTLPSTSRRAVGAEAEKLPMPTSPSELIRSRSAPLVLAVMALAPPAVSESVPASAVSPSVVVPLTVGVRTPPVAVSSCCTPKVLLICVAPEMVVAPVTFSVLSSVVAPVARSVLLTVVAPPTVVAPVTSKVPPMTLAPVARKVPPTSRR